MPKKRGLGSAPSQTKKRVSVLGGIAPHPNGRGLQKVNPADRARIAQKGWQASRAKRKQRKELKWLGQA